jgi:exopolysaccharide biosynthesis predicted pyruvyltransferase EpsI
VKTDRAHVMIAAALLGKVVEYWTSSYHKVPSIADYALKSFPVRRIEPEKLIRVAS